MKYLPIVLGLTAVMFGVLIGGEKFSSYFLGSDHQLNPVANQEQEYVSQKIKAPGKIEGATETIDLRARLQDQIRAIAVQAGDWVSQGDVLAVLDDATYIKQLELSQALYDVAVANRERLVNGARDSEIEAAEHEYQAHLTPLWSAEREFKRAKKLYTSKALNRQALDDLRAKVDGLKATAAAAKARLATLKLPAHQDELAAAQANVRAAKSRLQMAQINLERCQIIAPCDGRVLAINSWPGELVGPLTRQPVIQMADTRQLFAVAEVDEFDALAVKIGQRSTIVSSATRQPIADGTVAQVEPAMYPKKVFGQWAQERIDTYSRKVKIALSDASTEIPIGLPVEVVIQTSN